MTALITLTRTLTQNHGVGRVETIRTDVALFDDRTTRKRLVVTMPSGRQIDKGWSVEGRHVDPSVTADQFAAHYEAKGFTRAER